LLLTQYNCELDAVEGVVEEQALGILHLWFNKFKEAVLPSPTVRLSVIKHSLLQ
jgi:hypothetical protein